MTQLQWQKGGGNLDNEPPGRTSTEALTDLKFKLHQ